MSSNPFLATVETPFQVSSVDPVADPTGGKDSWFRYVISQGTNLNNAITGTRCGSLAEVNLQLNEMVARLNERRGKAQAKKK
jgi:hypothetical protein